MTLSGFHRLGVFAFLVSALGSGADDSLGESGSNGGVMDKAMDDAVWLSLMAAMSPWARNVGFLVEARARRLVVTAAHCLPQLPLAHAASYPAQRTYRKRWTACPSLTEP